MTKEEFTTQFNTLISAPTLDHAALATFRAQVEADYDASVVTQTTLDTAKSQIDDLTKANATLKDTNLRLFMMNPVNTPPTGDDGSPGNPPPTKDPDANKDPEADLTAVIDALVGKSDK